MQGTFIAAGLLNCGHAEHLIVCLLGELHSCYHSRTCHAFCGAHRSSAVAPNTRTGKVRAVAHLSEPCCRDQDQLLPCCSSGTIAACSEHWQQWHMLGHSSTHLTSAAAGTLEDLTCLACRLWCLAVAVLHDLRTLAPHQGSRLTLYVAGVVCALCCCCSSCSCSCPSACCSFRHHCSWHQRPEEPEGALVSHGCRQ
jgi:hypothetical protein